MIEGLFDLQQQLSFAKGKTIDKVELLCNREVVVTFTDDSKLYFTRGDFFEATRDHKGRFVHVPERTVDACFIGARTA